MKLEIDSDTADHIVICSLRDSIRTLKTEIKKLKMIKNPSDWDKKQLAEDILDIHALEKVYNYFGGNIK